MPTLQARISKGQKYWYVVHSQRINGKPRPVVLAYLGKIENILDLANGKKHPSDTKSYSHGAVAAFLTIAQKLDIVPIINKYICSKRNDWPEKPIRNDLTAGITFLLAAIGRACSPTSKQGWGDWAKGTSCSHLLRANLTKLDSQHFWDLMDCLSEETIPKIEEEILQKVLEIYPLEKDTLFYDTTNFFTFIDTENERCEIAQRGKNKQKRTDLRQVGMALVVTQKDYIPLLHHTYRGNTNDCEVFRKLVFSIKERMKNLNIDTENHTLVFDRGCNSKKNLRHVKRCHLFYVGALTPYHHEDLIQEASENLEKIKVGDRELDVYRAKKFIWGEERTVLVFISEKLQLGQIRGVYRTLKKKKLELQKIQKNLANPKAKKRTKEELEILLAKVQSGQFMDGLISYALTDLGEGKWSLSYQIEKKILQNLEDQLGFRIVMTNRHEWKSCDIIKAYYGQATVESSFKQIKNPYHLAVTPAYHWTDQKIKVHFFICVLGYLLSTLILHEAKKIKFNGTLDNLLDSLNDIRLATEIEMSGKKGKPKCAYKLEKMSSEQHELLKALNLTETHLKKLQISGVGVYN